MKKQAKILILFLLLSTFAFSQTVTFVGGSPKVETFELNSTTKIVTFKLQGDTNRTLDLTPVLIAGSGTDDQEITDLSLSGNTLSITLERGNTVTLDLTPILGGGSADGSETKISAGTNVTVTGLGTIASPYVITASGGGSTTLNNTTTSTAIDEAATANVAKVLQDQINGLSTGVANPNIIVANTLADITAAGANTTLEVRSNITLTANYAPPSNQHWIIAEGGLIDLDTYAITSDVKITLPEKGRKGLDLFSSTLRTGNAKITITNPIIYTSTLGAIDDNLETTDNYNFGLQALYIVNQNSGHLIWDKKDTGKYWAKVGESARDSPFFPISNQTSWIIGNGYNGVTVEHEGNVEIISTSGVINNSARYMFYNTVNSVVRGGTIRGDRYRHRYLRMLTISTPVTTAGNISISINITDPYNSTITTETVPLTIPVTVGTTTETATQVAAYINSNLGASGYVATSSGAVVTFYKDGKDFRFTALPNSTGATLATEAEPYEQGHGLMISSYVINPRIENIHITEFHGDGIVSSGQGNGTAPIRIADLTNGQINADGTIDAANTGFYYLTDIRDLPNYHEWFSFAPNSNASTDILHFKYWVAYYDASENFLEKSPTLVPYEKYTPRVYKDGRPEVAKYRVIVESNGVNIDDFYYFLNSRSDQVGVKLSQIEISYCRRQGISNLINFELRGSTIHDIGGTEPQFGIDLEDPTKHARGWIIDDNEFYNNANGDIIVKGATHGTISNNFFRQNSWNVRGTQDDKGLAIDTGYGRHMNIFGNYFEHKDISIDIDINFYGNNLSYSILSARPGGSVVSNNIFNNSMIWDGSPFSDDLSYSTGGQSKTKLFNNNFKISDAWGNKNFFDHANTIDFVDNFIEFNNTSIEHGQVTDPTLRYIDFRTTQLNYLRANRATNSTSGINNGTTRGLFIDKLTPKKTYLHNVGWANYATNIEDFSIDGSLIIENGYEKSFQISNGTIKGWVNLKLVEFPKTGTGTYQTLTFKDVVINIPEGIASNEGYLDNSGNGGASQKTNLFKVVKDVNLNLIFDNVTFDLDDADGSTLFMYLGHRGNTTFKDCKFISKTPVVINFNNSGTAGVANEFISSTNTGDIKNINPTLDGVSFIYRAGDTGEITNEDNIKTKTSGEPTGSTKASNIVLISQANYDAAVIANSLVTGTTYLIFD